MAWYSSSGDVLDGRKRAHHRWLDADGVGQQLRPDRRLKSVCVDRRDTVLHEQLGGGNLDEV